MQTKFASDSIPQRNAGTKFVESNQWDSSGAPSFKIVTITGLARHAQRVDHHIDSQKKPGPSQSLACGKRWDVAPGGVLFLWRNERWFGFSSLAAQNGQVNTRNANLGSESFVVSPHPISEW
jgi:hypothetical protein